MSDIYRILKCVQNNVATIPHYLASHAMTAIEISRIKSG